MWIDVCATGTPLKEELMLDNTIISMKSATKDLQAKYIVTLTLTLTHYRVQCFLC